MYERTFLRPYTVKKITKLYVPERNLNGTGTELERDWDGTGTEPWNRTNFI